MEVNIVTLIGILSSIVGVLLMLRVLPRQVRETRRPKNGFTRLRWYLLALPLIYSLAVILRIPRLFQILHAEHPNLVSTIASLSGSVIILSFAVFVYLIYTYKER